MLWGPPHPSLKLPGRTANSQGRTSTGKSHSIHGMRTLLPSLTYFLLVGQEPVQEAGAFLDENTHLSRDRHHLFPCDL